MLLKYSKITCFRDEKREADDEPPPSYTPCVRSKKTSRVSSVRGAGVHGDEWTHGIFQRATPHHTPQQHTKTETCRYRERERQRKKTEKTRQQKREERRFIFSVVVHGRSLLMESFFFQFARKTCACSTVSVKYDSSLISFKASWQANSFFKKKKNLRIIFHAVTV